MIELNLPKCRLRLEQREGKPYVYDELRRKFVRLTPEEWVRQHFVHYLIDVLGYPQPLMQNEVARASVRPRSDVTPSSTTRRSARR